MVSAMALAMVLESKSVMGSATVLATRLETQLATA
jgi:hypothetical protein